MKTMKRLLTIALAAVLSLSTFTACSDSADGFDKSRDIGVISRESGSGTRGAFIELFGIEQKNDAGEKVDHTTQKAVITDKTAVMMTTVAGDMYSIGYISLGSLNETVKAISIDGVAATVDNIKNNTYKIARPFNVAVRDDISASAQDFLSFILSSEGQAVIEANNYIPLDNISAYTGAEPDEKIVVAGSSSVTPVMEKLKEAYLELYPNAEIEIQQSDSSTGVASAIGGTCDIGMASRELKNSEIEQGVHAEVIAIDGIAVIVNNNSEVTNLTGEQVKRIFTGEATLWSDVLGE